ncbi:MAG TPA: ferric iron reductase [candidate division Zixibacteria bacterium]|nr:ferric iron reductase [candidate division Zixibacteria bacterium]
MSSSAAALLADPTLDATLARISALDRYLAAGVGRDRRDPRWWVTPRQLTGLDGAAVDRLLDAIGEHWGTSERRVQAAYLIGEYAWYVVAPVAASYLVEGRVARLSHDNVAVWLEPGETPGRLALRTRRFAALPTDALAGTGDVRLVPDQRALRELLQHEIVRHMAPIIGALRARTPLGLNAQWLEVADRTASALHHAGRLIGDEERGIREAEAIIRRPGSPLHSPRSRFVSYEHLGARKTVKLRGACCLTYRIADHGYCMTCPLIDEPERTERVRAWIAEELAQAAEPQ